jgi:hypothetical protein
MWNSSTRAAGCTCENVEGKDLIARMRGKGSVRMSTDEILALTRGDR